MKRFIVYLTVFGLLTGSFISVRAEASEWGVPVGGIHILKTNAMGEVLEGAVFQIARELKEGELTDRSLEKKLLKIGGENKIMVLEQFWTNREMTGEKQQEVTTDQTGNAAIYGLAYGTYYLVEATAPEGYNRITDPVRITIHKYSHLTEADNIRDDEDVLIDNTLHIINVRYTLPDTGNLAAIQLVVGGAGILFSTAALLMLIRRRWP